jgi:predicted RNA binding protein YcfA (HicA-like mRNA interferase family)
MPNYGPVKRKELINALRNVGFSGPFSGGKHQFMTRGDRTLHIPNPHTSDIGIQLLTRILKQAGISRAEWEKL